MSILLVEKRTVWLSAAHGCLNVSIPLSTGARFAGWSTWSCANKGVFLSLAAGGVAPRVLSVATSGRGSISLEICRPTRPPRRPFAYLDASGSCVHNPPPTSPADTPPQITAYKANFIGTCMQYAQGAGPNCTSADHPPRLLWYPTSLVYRPLHLESWLKASLFQTLFQYIALSQSR